MRFRGNTSGEIYEITFRNGYAPATVLNSKGPSETMENSPSGLFLVLNNGLLSCTKETFRPDTEFKYVGFVS